MVKTGVLPSLAIILLLCVPATAQKIATGYAEGFPIGELKTFQFLKQERKSPDGLADDPESEQFIRERLGEELIAAGLRPVEANPDFVIAFYAKTYLRTSYRVLNYKTYDSDLALSEDHYDMGTLVVDFISVQHNQAVWRGRADKAVNQKNAPKVVRQVAKKLVKQFQKDAKQQAKKIKKR